MGRSLPHSIAYIMSLIDKDIPDYTQVYSAFEVLRKKSGYSAPEIIPDRWLELINLLNTHIMDHRGTEWEKKIREFVSSGEEPPIPS